MKNVKYTLAVAACGMLALWCSAVNAQELADIDTLPNAVETDTAAQDSPEYEDTPVDVPEPDVEEEDEPVLTKKQLRQKEKAESAARKADKKAKTAADKERRRIAKFGSHAPYTILSEDDIENKKAAAANNQTVEEQIAALQRALGKLTRDIEANNRSQEAKLEAALAQVQFAATSAEESARTAQTALKKQSQIREMTPQEKNRAAEKKALTAARKEANSLMFRIQISARQNRIDDINAQFAEYNLGMKISEEEHNSMYKYTVGSYRQVDAAIETCNEVRNKGIRDAFVVAYHKGNRISMNEAYNLLGRN